MFSHIKDIRTNKTYKFIKFIEWFHNESAIELKQHIEHGPHILAEDSNFNQIKIPLNYVEFFNKETR